MKLPVDLQSCSAKGLRSSTPGPRASTAGGRGTARWACVQVRTVQHPTR